MSSLMTNASAMTALKTLQMTNKSLDQTENRIRSTERVLGDALFKKSVRRGGINRPSDIAETSPPGFTSRGIDIEGAPV